MMKYIQHKLAFTGEQRAIEIYGDAVWCWVCDNYGLWWTFKATTVGDSCPVLQSLSARTRADYARAILNNVIRENSGALGKIGVRYQLLG